MTAGSWRIPRVVIAAPASGAGKTSVTTGLLAAFAQRGCVVAPHKVGRAPDTALYAAFQLLTALLLRSAASSSFQAGPGLLRALARQHNVCRASLAGQTIRRPMAAESRSLSRIGR